MAFLWLSYGLWFEKNQKFLLSVDFLEGIKFLRYYTSNTSQMLDLLLLKPIQNSTKTLHPTQPLPRHAGKPALQLI